MTDIPNPPSASEPAEPDGRPAWLIPTLVAAAIAVVVVIAVIVASDSDSDDEAEETTTTTEAEETTTTTEAEETTTTTEAEETTTTEAEETTTTEVEETTTTEAPPEGPEVELTIDDGDPVVFVVTSCVNPGETTLMLEAESKEDDEDVDPIGLEVDVEDGEGTIILSGREEAEGTVDQLMVGDTGEITASGELTPSDDGAEPSSYELVGSCS